MGWVQGRYESSLNVGLKAGRSLFRPDLECPLEISLLVGTRVQHELMINNSPNSELSDGGDTGPLLEICLLGEGGSGIYGSAVAVGVMFCMSYMDACNTASHKQSRGLRDDLTGGKGGAWVAL